MATSSSNRQRGGPAPTAPCPVCGTPTVGIHIAGTVFDHTCDPCADGIGTAFRSLVNRTVKAARA